MRLGPEDVSYSRLRVVFGDHVTIGDHGQRQWSKTMVKDNGQRQWSKTVGDRSRGCASWTPSWTPGGGAAETPVRPVGRLGPGGRLGTGGRLGRGVTGRGGFAVCVLSPARLYVFRVRITWCSPSPARFACSESASLIRAPRQDSRVPQRRPLPSQGGDGSPREEGARGRLEGGGWGIADSESLWLGSSSES